MNARGSFPVPRRTSVNRHPPRRAQSGVESNSIFISGLPLWAESDYVSGLALGYSLTDSKNNGGIEIFPAKNGDQYKNARIDFISITEARRFLDAWHKEIPPGSDNKLTVKYYEARIPIAPRLNASNSSDATTPKIKNVPVKETNSVMIKGLPDNRTVSDIQYFVGENIAQGKRSQPLITIFPPRDGFCSARVIFTTIQATRKFIEDHHRKTYPGYSNKLSVEYYYDKNAAQPNVDEQSAHRMRHVSAAISKSVIVKGLPSNCNEDFIQTFVKQSIAMGDKGKRLIAIFPFESHSNAKITFETTEAAQQFISEYHRKPPPGYTNKLTVQFYLDMEGPLVSSRQFQSATTTVRNVVYVEGLSKVIDESHLIQIIREHTNNIPTMAKIFRNSDGTSEGRGTVSFREAADAQECIGSLNGERIKEWAIQLKLELFKCTKVRRLSTTVANDHLFDGQTSGYAYDCVVCYQTWDEKDMIGCTPIGHNHVDLQTHYLCQECVRRNCSVVMVDGILGEKGTGLPCAEMGSPIQRILLDQQTINLLDKRLTEDCFRDIEGMEWCKEDCGYGVFIAQDTQRMQFFSCQREECMAQFCRICKVSFSEHYGRSCNDVDPEGEQRGKISNKMEDHLSDAVICKCPTCGIPVNKDGGCNHMTCGCGTDFCYCCKQKFESVRVHYSSGRCTLIRYGVDLDRQRLVQAVRNVYMDPETKELVEQLHQTSFRR